MVVAEPTVASARLLDLDWKLYHSNMLRMLKKDLTRSWTPKFSKPKKGSVGRVDSDMHKTTTSEST